VLKNLQVVFGTVSALLGAWLVINGSHESYESIWYDPVQVSVLHLFVVLVLFVVKISKLVPPVADCDLQTLETVENGALVGARVPVAGVPKSPKLFLVGSERLPNNFSRLLQNYNHERPHQERCICLLVKLC